MAQLKNLVENNFALLLLLGGGLGFFLPGFGDLSNNIIIVLLAAQIYCACPAINRGEMFQVDVFQVGLFTLLRFAIFPIILYYFSRLLFPDYAIGILLLSLMPSAIVVASLCMISRAKVALGVSLTVISSFLVPAIIPGIFSFLGHQVDVNEVGLFITLTLVIFLPFLIYFYGATRFEKHKSWIEENGKALSVFIMALVLFVIISSYKEQFLEDVELLLEGALIMFVLFFVFYLFGFVFSLFTPKDQRSTYIWASGAINNGLAIGLSFIYFSPQITFFVVISEIVWCLYVAAAQWWFSKNAII